MTAAAASNAQVAKDIGMTHSGVSRIRSGDRLPSIDRMVAIQKAYGWSTDDQIKARTAGRYAAAFEQVLADKYGAFTRDLPVQPSA